jgi:hypothetical protein
MSIRTSLALFLNAASLMGRRPSTSRLLTLTPGAASSKAADSRWPLERGSAPAQAWSGVNLAGVAALISAPPASKTRTTPG